MKFHFACLAMGALVLSTVVRLPAAQGTIVAGPVENGIDLGNLVNAPNGHISFQKEPGGDRIWVSGRQNDFEGGFLLDVHDWTPGALALSQSTLVLGHDQKDCTMNDPTLFDRNYAALNAVMPGSDSNTLLGFYDAEYHVDCPDGQPLLSSIGLATSNDGGITWDNRQQVIQGLDEANYTFDFVTAAQQADGTHESDDGASGPSAVVRVDAGVPYVYVYYADRTPIRGGDDSVYVARAPLAGNGLDGGWQKWTGAGWGTAGDQRFAAPVVVPAPGDAALQPHVSWNSALGRWLMVFKATSDFETSTSADGVHWSEAVSLLVFDPHDAKTGFPTLISPYTGTQQITGEVGWLYYSALPKDGTQYLGHRAPFRISDE